MPRVPFKDQTSHYGHRDLDVLHVSGSKTPPVRRSITLLPDLHRPPTGRVEPSISHVNLDQEPIPSPTRV